MKKAKIALTAVTMMTVMGTALAFKAVKRTVIIYFTTTSYNATATQTLTKAATTAAGFGSYRYYTLADNAKATLHGNVIKVNE